ncbi:hypothetical protein DFH07DRAFT_760601, partial [Mycena maculata]
PKVTLSNEGRPEEVGTWIKYVQKGILTIENGQAFAEKWENWWRALNPDWRVAEDGTPLREERGAWDKMEAPGANGFLGVLACLKWWKLKVDIADGDKRWAAAVADVMWVLSRMVKQYALPHFFVKQN